MNERVVFDDRLLNPYDVEDLETPHPKVHSALRAWFKAIGDFDDAALNGLIGARGAEEVARWRDKGEAALAAAPGVAQTLDAVIAALGEAKDSSPGESERLSSLLEAARANRRALLETAPALVTRALGGLAAYGAERRGTSDLVEETTLAIEQLASRAGDGTRPFADLRPLLSELEKFQSRMNRRLQSLPKIERRAVTAPFETRLRAAAQAVCRALYAAKTRDRKAGVLAAAELSEWRGERGAPVSFARALRAGDFAGAHALLAPWLYAEWTANALSAAVRRDTAAAAHAAGVIEPPPIAALDVGTNPLTLSGLREVRPEVPREVTEENFAGWFQISFHPEDEDCQLTDVDVLFTWWVVAVRTSEGERIGYLSVGA